MATQANTSEVQQLFIVKTDRSVKLDEDKENRVENRGRASILWAEQMTTVLKKQLNNPASCFSTAGQVEKQSKEEWHCP